VASLPFAPTIGFPGAKDVDTPLVLHITNIAVGANDSYSSSLAFGLMGCSLAQIVFNIGMTLNLMPTSA
jgi:cell division protein FtsW (lipid II flippase)